MTSKQNNPSDSSKTSSRPNLASIRKKIQAGLSPKQWRGLDELAENPEFQEALEKEFPRQTAAAEFNTPIGRRSFLKLMAASLAMAGLSSCRPRKTETILPYVQAQPGLTPGEPIFYTTAMEFEGYGRGLLIRSREGRPVKVEGNPQHPDSLGATDVFAQASILSLYNPERAQVIQHQGVISTWDTFLSAINQVIESQRGQGGAGLRLLTGSFSSPTLLSQVTALLDQFPQARWVRYDPVGKAGADEGARLALGRRADTIYNFENADVILALDGDFTCTGPGSVRYARQFAARRKAGQAAEMSRLYVVESGLSNLGALADHRLAVPASSILGFAAALAGGLGVIPQPQNPPAAPQGWIETLAADLQSKKGRSLVYAGAHQPAEVHALAHSINAALGNVGQTVEYIDPVIPDIEGRMETLAELAAELDAGQVSLLVTLDGNPVYTAPADLNLRARYAKAGIQLYLGMENDETAALSTWHVPATHYLEMWSDTRAFDGTLSIIQPLIEPLYGGRSPHELLALFTGQAGTSGYDIVRQFWQNNSGAADFAGWWSQALQTGVAADSAFAPITASLTFDPASLQAPAGQPSGVEVVFRPDPHVWDGRFTGNAWMQELPRPMTRLTWDNAAHLSPALAQRLGVTNEDVIRLTLDGRSLNAPVWVLPGMADNSITVTLGFGRTAGGDVAVGHGYDAYAIRSSAAPWIAQGAEVQPTGGHYQLASTQVHQVMDGRDLARAGDIADFQKNPEMFHAGEHGGDNPPSLYSEHPYPGYAWGMSINLSACMGCNACVVACQSENNIPVVGKDQVLNSREMHWLRIDTYFEGGLDDPEVLFQPVLCMHCENAPCEPVCPVEATVHSPEGINEMVYNRCVGTRYCSNNCPYKVRRFNFLQYSEHGSIPLQLMFNPEVTVRSRGVMEKCNYCVQRVNAARIQHQISGTSIPDGELVTACQQACPTNAIIFGNINDPNSQVSQLKALPHDYGLLTEVGTRPRTSYLARLRNPNPDMPA